MRRIHLLPVFFGIFALFIILASTAVLADTLQPRIEQRLKYGPTLYISDIHTIPPEIEPGSSGVLSLKFENVASHQIRDIIINLELPSQFAPADINKKKIRVLDGFNETGVTFDILALPDSDEGIYKVPLIINYIDEIGTSYSENDTISLKIAQKPKIFTEMTSSEIYEKNLLGKVNIKIANIGIGDVKFLVAELLPSEQKEYDIIGPSKDYIGEIPSDDYDTVDFKIKSSKNTGIINLNLKLDYADANNREYAETVQTPLRIITAREAGIKKNNALLFIAIGLLILYIVYRQVKKRLKRQRVK